MKKIILSLLLVYSHVSNSQYLGDRFYGIASHYANNFYGKITANGEILDKINFTAAHKTLPFNTLVEVTNLKNNQSIIVRINDRGPYIPGRVIDLAHASAQAIGVIKRGTVPVRLTVLGLNKKEMLIPQAEFKINKDLKLSKKFYQKSKIESFQGYKKNLKFKEEIKKQLRLRRYRDFKLN